MCSACHMTFSLQPLVIVAARPTHVRTTSYSLIYPMQCTVFSSWNRLFPLVLFSQGPCPVLMRPCLRKALQRSQGDILLRVFSTAQRLVKPGLAFRQAPLKQTCLSFCLHCCPLFFLNVPRAPEAPAHGRNNSKQPGRRSSGGAV